MDTNVIVRYILQDDPDQSKQATDLIEGDLSGDEPGSIALLALAEILWVLKTVYRIPKAGLVTVVEGLLATRQLRIEQSELVFRALRAYRVGNGDFSDALIAMTGKANGCDAVLTFNRKATNVGMRLIGSPNG